MPSAPEIVTRSELACPPPQISSRSRHCPHFESELRHPHSSIIPTKWDASLRVGSEARLPLPRPPPPSTIDLPPPRCHTRAYHRQAGDDGRMQYATRPFMDTSLHSDETAMVRVVASAPRPSTRPRALHECSREDPPRAQPASSPPPVIEISSLPALRHLRAQPRMFAMACEATLATAPSEALGM